MTRFARAQGSKSSNERVPQEATSWAEMKQQLTVNKVEVDDSKKKEFLELREKNYKNFLTENIFKQDHTWADFGDFATPDFIPLTTEKNDVNSKVEGVNSKPMKSKKNGKVENVNTKSVKSKDIKQKIELQEGLTKPDVEVKVEKSQSNYVKLENIEQNCNIIVTKNKIESSQAKRVKENKVVSSVLPKVERVFANENDRLLYEKKVARRLRQKEKVRQRKEILSANDNNRLTAVIKEREEKRKEKRFKHVLAKKAERERLKGLNESGITEVLTNTQKRKRRKAKKADLTTKSSAGNDDKNQVEIEPEKNLSETTSKKKKRNTSETASEKPTSEKDYSEIKAAVGNQKKQKKKIKVSEAASEEISSENQPDVNIHEENQNKLKKKRKAPEAAIEETGSENLLEHVEKQNKKSKVSEAGIGKATLENQPDVNGNVKKKKNLKNSKKRLRNKKRIIKAQVEPIEKKNTENSNNHSRNKSSGDGKERNDKPDQNKGNQQNDKPIKEHKLKNSKWTGDHRKKPIGPEITTLRLNGRSIEIALFDGFPVRIADHERLTQLRKEMISKGVPRSEVQRAMQLERRRSEKALAREKKEVCFHCRKAGHKLTECPDALKQETEATGICFKCGSTEHTHFECKVVQAQQFKFATCFICREPGHIAKQCPQNARGIYPQGGCCKVCGDVTHLKKDCPQYQAQQEHDTIQVDTIDGTNLEALDLEKDEVKVKAVATPVKKTKVVTF